MNHSGSASQIALGNQVFISMIIAIFPGFIGVLVRYSLSSLLSVFVFSLLFPIKYHTINNPIYLFLLLIYKTHNG